MELCLITAGGLCRPNPAVRSGRAQALPTAGCSLVDLPSAPPPFEDWAGVGADITWDDMPCTRPEGAALGGGTRLFDQASCGGEPIAWRRGAAPPAAGSCRLHGFLTMIYPLFRRLPLRCGGPGPVARDECAVGRATLWHLARGRSRRGWPRLRAMRGSAKLRLAGTLPRQTSAAHAKGPRRGLCSSFSSDPLGLQPQIICRAI